jgi:hypothetical protein
LLDELEEPVDRVTAKATPQYDLGEDAETGAHVARQLRASLGLGVDGVQNLEQFAESQLGLDVAVEPLGSSASGVVVQAEGGTLVMVNSDEVHARQRFTLAHEIGHFLLDDVDLIVEDDDDRPELEERADAFAAEFLMPEEGLRRIGGGFDAPQVFVRTMLMFGVSRRALARRLEQLGLIDSPTRQSYEDADIGLMFRQAGQSDAFTEFESRVGRRRLPARIEARGMAAYQRARIGIGPLAALMARDALELEAELDEAGLTPRAFDAIPLPADAL